MADFRIVIEGDGADHAADDLTAILAEGEPAAAISRSAVALAPGPAIKTGVDPVALTAAVLAIPGAVLAVVDMADRIRKRSKAQKLVDAAKRLRNEKHVTLTVTAPDGATWSLDRLEVDTVLEIADRANRAS